MKYRILCLLLLCACKGSAMAAGYIHPYFQPEKSEMLVLPAYCRAKATLPNHDPGTKRWVGLFGSDYGHMHHYCEGLLSLNRGDSGTMQSAKSSTYYYERAIREFAYMEGAVSRDFKIWPELLVKKGDAYARLRDYANAENYYQKSYIGYPEYPVAAMRLVDFYLERGRISEAEKINNSALERFGKKKSFMRRAKKIREARNR